MMFIVRVVMLQALLILYTISAEAERVMRPKFKEVKLWSDNIYVTHTITYDMADPHMNFTINVLQDLHDVDLNTEVRIAHKEDPTYFFSTNSTMPLCKILNWRAQSPIGGLIHAYLKEYGPIFETCPITKGQYYLHKIWIPEDTASALIPELDFEVSFMAYHVDASKKRTLIINDHITGEGLVQDVTNLKRGILAMLPRGG